jgi:hypothetical protein
MTGKGQLCSLFRYSLFLKSLNFQISSHIFKIVCSFLCVTLLDNFCFTLIFLPPSFIFFGFVSIDFAFPSSHLYLPSKNVRQKHQTRK